MKKLAAAFLITSMAALGCGKESEPGGPGADPVRTANGNGDTDFRNEDNMFRLVAPEGATDLEPGKTETISISIRRGDQFREAVVLTFTAPEGITIQPSEVTLQPEQDEAEVALTVAPGTRVGEHAIRVQGMPASGQNPTTVTFNVEVEEPDRDDINNLDQPRGAAPVTPADPVQPAEPVQP
ncbi:MAG TPA: hypothetical protein VML55_14390 [Planctomycetaceae bacterium]|nr:hypothetical protein [Planctomycetaceae bacterium]